MLVAMIAAEKCVDNAAAETMPCRVFEEGQRLLARCADDERMWVSDGSTTLLRSGFYAPCNDDFN